MNGNAEFWAALVGAALTIALGGVFVASNLAPMIQADPATRKRDRIKGTIFCGVLTLLVWALSGLVAWNGLHVLLGASASDANANANLTILAFAFGVLAFVAVIVCIAAVSAVYDKAPDSGGNQIEPTVRKPLPGLAYGSVPGVRLGAVLLGAAVGVLLGAGLKAARIAKGPVETDPLAGQAKSH